MISHERLVQKSQRCEKWRAGCRPEKPQYKSAGGLRER